MIRQQQARLLTPVDHREVEEFLARDPVENVYLLWRLESGILSRSDGLEMMLGVPEVPGAPLRALVGLGANLVPAGADLEGFEGLGRAARGRHQSPRMIIGACESLEALWRGYSRGSPPPVQLDCLHVSYELRPEDLAQDLTLPQLRLAQPRDQEDVEDASAAMLLEDLGRRDREEDPAFFRRRIRYAIRQEEIHICRHRRQLAFKINLGARARGVTQLQGVYTAEALRGRGVGRRGCAEICRRLFDAGTQVVTLFVREENQAARQVYEAVGFRPRGVIRMIILARTPGEP